MAGFLTGILAWRKYVDDIYGGLAAYDQPASAGTILYGCETWLASGAGDAATREQVTQIKAEIEGWLAERSKAPKSSP